MNKATTIISSIMILILSYLLLTSPTPSETPQTKQPLIYAAGDSITEGWALKYKSDSWPNQLSKKLGYPIINTAHAGQGLLSREYKYGTLLETFGREVVDQKPDIVVIGIGINDIAGNSTEDILSAFLDLQKQADDAQIETYWLSITPLGNTKIVDINRWLKNTFQEHYIDTYGLLVGEDGFLAPQYDVGDRVHVSEAGCKVIAGQVYKRLDIRPWYEIAAGKHAVVSSNKDGEQK